MQLNCSTRRLVVVVAARSNVSRRINHCKLQFRRDASLDVKAGHTTKLCPLACWASMHTTLALAPERTEASIVERGTVYMREGSGVLSLLVTRGRRATRSDTQTTMLIQVHLRTRRGGDLAHGERCGVAQYEYKLYRCVQYELCCLAHEERCGMAQYELCGCADVRMAHEEQCGIGSVADDERFCGKATTSA